MNDRRIASVVVPGRIESVRPAAVFLVEMARSFGVPASADHLFEVALVEALSNALKHSGRDTDGALQLHCEIEVAGRVLHVRVLDEAARAPLAFAIPTGAVPWSDATPDSLESVPETGYGLYVMRAVFPHIVPVTRDGRHGIEMRLEF
jgi:anti-sigma regulatory factor (Ser/Thr protein kinase)